MKFSVWGYCSSAGMNILVYVFGRVHILVGSVLSCPKYKYVQMVILVDTTNFLKWLRQLYSTVMDESLVA